MHQLETLGNVALQVATQSPAAVYLARLGPGSRRVQRAALVWLAREASANTAGPADLPWHLLSYLHTQVLRQRVSVEYAPATANRYLAALRGVLKEAWRMNLMTAQEHAQAADLEPVPGKKIPTGRAVEKPDVVALFARCGREGGPGRARDAAMLAVLFGAGLRRAEVTALTLSDYTRHTGAVWVRQGKGSKERLSYLSAGGRAAVEAWLEFRGAEPGPLLCPVTRHGRIEIRRMSEQALYATLRRRASKAAIERFTPHDARRTFISSLLDAGADLVSVAELAGHENVQTTARYDRRGERAKRRAAALLDIPFQPAA